MCAMAEHPEFIRRQYEFTAYIRDPESNPAPIDVAPRRMAVYRELLWNNVEDFLTSAYPVLADIMGPERWQALLRHYFASHRAETPLFPEMPREFLRYLKTAYEALADDPPFIHELAHYEWMELAVARDDADIDWQTIVPDGDLLDGHPVVSPLAQVVEYRYPVHRLSREFRPDAPGETPTVIVIYRDGDDEVQFMEINAVTARLISLLQADVSLTGRNALAAIAEAMRHPDSSAVIRFGNDTLQDLRRRGVILGTAG
jgi:hypothetical protein